MEQTDNIYLRDSLLSKLKELLKSLPQPTIEMLEEHFRSLQEFLNAEILYTDLVYELVEDGEYKRIKALLLQMRLRMRKTIGAIKLIWRLLLSQVSLLFGLCSSQSSLILDAFFGNSLSRIPSI